MKNIFVIIPAYNEEKSIGLVVHEIPKNIVSEIIVVNNNSTDATDEHAKLAGATVLFESYQGYGAACLKGIEYLKNKNCDIVVFMDGDFSDYPEELSLLINPILQDNFDFVVGSRILGKREKGSLPFQSRFGSVVAGLLINLFWRIKYTDLGPFRAIKFEKLLRLNMDDKWYGWTVQMQIRAAKQKLKTIEVPVSYKKRIGKSKVTGTLKGTVMASIIILKTIFKEFFIY
ncbi:MAG: glycosyltransferase family 2 protein [Ignavibacteriales bacterium]|nr:glycosyltransferase family 2 protein [Ignavibacteriales bacterium]